MLVQFVDYHNLDDKKLKIETTGKLPEQDFVLKPKSRKSSLPIPSERIEKNPFWVWSTVELDIPRVGPEFITEHRSGKDWWEVCFREIAEKARKIFFDLPLTKKEFKEELLLQAEDINCRPPQRDKCGNTVPGRIGGRDYLYLASMK